MPPSSSSYTAGIDVVTRDSSGNVTPLGGETIEIRNYLTGSVITAITTDANGFLVGQMLGSTASGLQVEFYSGSRTGSLVMWTAETAEEAFSTEVTLILDDAYAPTKTPDVVDLYLRDNSDTETRFEFLATQPRNTTVKYRKELLTATDFDVIGQSRTNDGQYARTAPENSAFDALGSISSFASDIRFTSSTAGIIFPDRSTGDLYRAFVDDGVLRTEYVTTASTNYALASNGSTASASSAAAGYAASNTIDGKRHTNNAWGTAGGWNDAGATSGVGETLTIDFGATRSISRVDLFFLKDSVNYNTNPAWGDTFTLYGVTGYSLHYWNGSSWVLLQTVTGNTKVWRQYTFPAKSMSKIRFTANTVQANAARVVEFEAWG